MIEKVTDPFKIVTDELVLKRIAEQGEDWQYWEFSQDYAMPDLVDGKKLKGKSPNAKFYRDLKSNKQMMVVSGLPMVTADGKKIEVGWKEAGVNYFSEKNNLFRCKVQGTQVETTVRNDQPDGRKAGDKLTYHPQVFLDGAEQIPLLSVLLDIDPINQNYTWNVIEWDYGICKRLFRNIEGHLFGYWVFPGKPSGTVSIKYNQTGDYRLKLGQFKVNDDEEVITPEGFDKLAEFLGGGYPVTVSDSDTYYPDAGINSVDGFTNHVNAGGLTWAALMAEAGTGFDDSGTAIYGVNLQSDETPNEWEYNYRALLLFDSSGLDDAANISAVTLSLYGYVKDDNLGIAPDANIYASDPIANIALEAADYHTSHHGDTPFCDTPITFANWRTSSPWWNDFAFNAAGIAAISKTGISKFGFRNANYDVSGTPPSWSSLLYSYHGAYASEQGAGYKPKLFVTFTIGGPQHYDRSYTALLGLKATASRAVAHTRSDTGLLGLLSTAARAIVHTRTDTALLGLKSTATRAIVLSRSDTALLGLKATASRAVAYKEKAITALLGLKATASKTIAYIRTETALLGLKSTASRAIALTRTDTALLGLKATATRAIALTRTDTALLGLATTASRVMAIVRSLSTSVGLVTTLSKIQELARSLTTAIGLVTSMVTQFRQPRRVRGVGTNRTQSSVGTNRTIEDTGTERHIKGW